MMKTATETKRVEVLEKVRPETKNGGSCVTTPIAATMIALLGSGYVHGGVALSRDEYRNLAKVYGFKPEKPKKQPPKPVRKTDPEGTNSYERRLADEKHERAVDVWSRWEDPRAFSQAGADRNMIRHAEHDGLRLVAWLAKHVPAGEDPLKSLIQAVIQAGWDVEPEDIQYASDEPADAEEAPPKTPKTRKRA